MPERGGQAKSAGVVNLLRYWVVSLTGFSNNLSPLLHLHYRSFISTTAQSAPAMHFGILPLS